MNMKKFTLTVLRASPHTAYGNPKGITTPVTDFLRPAVCALGLVVSLMALGAAPPARAQPRYTITDLGTLGGSVSYATGINNSGQVVGNSNTASGQSHAFRTAANSAINPATDDLGALVCISAAFGINNSGQVVGYSTQTCFGADPVAFRTAPNSPINPATDILGGAVATGINDSGQVVGNPTFSPTPSGRPPTVLSKTISAASAVAAAMLPESTISAKSSALPLSCIAALLCTTSTT